ncbi:MAG: hypothetical protein P1V97_07970 [Planctomycetota bacterium]|nr:hypothetical protein [Planctomycetota bacterium]
MKHTPNKVNKRKIAQFVLLTTLAVFAIVRSQNLPCLGCFGDHTNFPSTHTDKVLWAFDSEGANPRPERCFVDNTNENLGSLIEEDLKISLNDDQGSHVIWDYAEYDQVLKISNHRNLAVRVYVSRVLALNDGLWVFEIDLKTHEVRDYALDCRFSE